MRVDGSSTVFPITEAVAEEFGIEHPEVHVAVAFSGTGGGMKKLIAKEIGLAGASRPIKAEELEATKAAGVEFIELPVAYDALAVVVHPENTWAESLTIDELRIAWEPGAQNVVKSWSQIRPGFPDEPLGLYGPGVDSGTYDYFTEAVCGEEGASRGDFQASEDDNVLVQGVSNDPAALGFFGMAYLTQNEGLVKAVAIDDGNPDNGDGPQAPTKDNVINGVYRPLSRPLFIYVNVDRSFAFDAPMGPVELELTYWDGGYQRGWIEYDSLDLTASVRAGAFKSGPSLPPSTSEGWRRVTFQLDDMRFGDRCNRADLRLVIEGGLPAIAEVRVRLLGQPEAR